MKTIEIIKKNALAALALAMILGFSAFKAGKTTNQSPYYPMVNGVYQSTPLDPAKEGDLEDGWDCIDVPETCSAQFSTPPSPTNQTPDGDIRQGLFEDHSSN